MNIQYGVFLKDTQSGLEILLELFDQVEDSIKYHKDASCLEYFQQLVRLYVQDHLGEIDQYYIDNPFKRFELTLEVLYGDE